MSEVPLYPYNKAPPSTGTVMFLHWLAGMIFIFYLASFVMLLREVLRPGVLWFLRNLNDQNFHPINEVESCSVDNLTLILGGRAKVKAVTCSKTGRYPYHLIGPLSHIHACD